MSNNDTAAYNSVNGQYLTVVQSIQAAASGFGLTFPILKNPATAVAKLLLGKDASLIASDKDFVLNANRSADLDLPDMKVFDLDVEYEGGLQITGGLHLGYDTFGLRQAMGAVRAGQLSNVGSAMLKGYFIDEAATGFSVSGMPFTAEAGVNVGGFFDVSIDGAVIVTLTLHPYENNDPNIGNNDGEIRYDEIDPNCRFTVSGELTGNLAIEMAVGFDTAIGFIGWRDSFELATVSLLNFGTGLCIGMFSGSSPEIAGLSNGVLTLYMGANAGQLSNFDAPENGAGGHRRRELRRHPGPDHRAGHHPDRHRQGLQRHSGRGLQLRRRANREL
jgi:hypothetical protein